jgi:hypothetical protein
MIVCSGLVLAVLLLAIVNLGCFRLSLRRIRGLLQRSVLLFVVALAPAVLSGCSGLVSGASTTGNPPPSALNITNVQAASNTTSSSQIVWTTNVAADSALDYGTSASYGSSTLIDSAMITSHQVTLSGLAAGTTYYYQVNSTDSKGNHAHSGGHSFKTSGFSISGTISPATGGSGAMLTLGGAASTTTTTDGVGNYTFAGLANGTYTIAPSHAGYAFTPNNQSATVNGANVTGVNFTDNVAPAAPTITTQPANQTVTAGQTASFSVTATGTAPLSYQWNRSGTAISGATSSTYTTSATTSSDNGAQFTVLVSNTVGSVTSNAAALTVTAAPVAPSITTQPASQTVTAGQTASFSVAATGTTPLTYQWKKNSVAISGATSSSYTTSTTTSSDNGALFTVLVSNTVGSVTSNAAALTVNPPPVQITTGSLPAGQVQTAYSTTLQASGGTAPYTWSLLSGQLPNGLTLSSSSGTISGTPAVAALFNFTIQVRDTAGALASTGFSINIAAVAHWTVLTWNPSTSVVVGYNIYRGTTSGGPYTTRNSSVVPGITYTDSTVQSGLTYFYVVTAVDSSNVESVHSNEVSAAIP